MKKGTFIIFILLIILIIAGRIVMLQERHIDQFQAKKGEEIRAALDIGSGSTNLKIAIVNLSTDKIVRVLEEQSIPVPYQKHLEQSSDNTFDPAIMKQGIASIQELKSIADSFHIKKIAAVATAAFRQANNAQDYAKAVENQTGVKIRIINQDEEGILAFRAALAVTSINPEKVLVWDIGGGSMQLTTLTNQGTYIVEKGKTASIPFKNAIIQKIENKDPAKVTTPNPMTPEQIQAAIQLSQTYADQTDPVIKSKIADPDTNVIAVGSLFNYGIRPLVTGSEDLTANQLRQAVMGLSYKSDEELPGGALAEVAVSNPILVLGYMDGLNMTSLQIISVNNADGALTYPAYWQ